MSKVIIDTSVWIDHIKQSNSSLVHLLQNGRVLMHSAILGELAVGQFKHRSELLQDFKLLPKCEDLNLDELLVFIDNYSLHGKGLSFVDVQLLASAKLSSASIFTYDKILEKYADHVLEQNHH